MEKEKQSIGEIVYIFIVGLVTLMIMISFYQMYGSMG